MAQVINTNVASLNAQRNLSMSQASLATSLQRLSSGLRINSAKDDAAGLAISDRFTAQIRGLDQASRNANDGISLSQTAEGALAEVTNNLQRIRELSVQSANATNSATDRAALQSEVAQALAEINRVASNTSFNGVKLLDGSFTSQAFQVGANSGETITVSSLVDARIARLGTDTLTADGTVTGNTSAANAGGVANVNGIAAEANLTLTTANGGTTSAISYAISSGADVIAAAINSAASSIGITATATNSTTLTSLSAPGTVSFTLNGQAVSAVVADQNDLTNLVSAINGVAATSGVTATFSSSSSKSSITLSTTDGRNIKLDDFLNGVTTASFGGVTLTSGGATDSAVATGLVSLSSTKGAISTAGADATVFAVAGVNNSSFNSLAAVDISTVAGASSALAVLDSALAKVSSGRADLGAIQNRFTSVVANLATTIENFSASRSRIVDADFAKETANLTRSQILQQAGVAMLAQANAVPQSVLSLLR